MHAWLQMRSGAMLTSDKWRAQASARLILAVPDWAICMRKLPSSLGAAWSAAMTGLVVPLGHLAGPVTTVWVRSGSGVVRRAYKPPLLLHEPRSASQGRSATPAPRARARARTHPPGAVVHLEKEFV